MPVYKYKSLKEASEDLWFLDDPKTLLKRLRNFYDLKKYLHKAQVIRGIRKFSTFEDANKAKLEEILDNSSRYD
jgi:phage-related protein